MPGHKGKLYYQTPEMSTKKNKIFAFASVRKKIRLAKISVPWYTIMSWFTVLTETELDLQ